MSQTLLNIETAIGGIGRGFASAPVTLGGVTLTGVEVPSTLDIGGRQQIVIHRLPGGDRIINATGNDPNQITLSGMFAGPNTAARYQALSAMRAAGAAVTLSVAGSSLLVVITGFRYVYGQRGIVVGYTIEVEIVPQLASSQPTDGTSALASLIGPNTAAAVMSVTNTIATAATYVQNVAGQVSTAVGEITPVAPIIGLGGPLAGVSNQLTAASALSGSLTSLSSAPASLAGFVTDIQAAGAGLMTTISQAGGSLVGISQAAPNGIALDEPSLQAVVAHAGVLVGAVTTGGLVNQALAGAAQTSGTAYAGPVVHS